jgi:diguanylate cyclase
LPDFANEERPAGRTAGEAERSLREYSDDERNARLVDSVKRTQLVIAVAYLYDSLILFGYWAAGFVELRVPMAVIGLLAGLVATVRVAHLSGWSLKRKDPTLFLPQQLFAIAVALGVALAAPAIGFQPFATLFAISTFSFMAPNPTSLVISWIAVAIGASAVIFAVGPQLAIPTSSLAGQALTSFVLVGLLARCIWIAMFVRKLRGRLTEKNEALRRAMAQIEKLASTDEVTGLPNRRSIAALLQEHIAIADRTGLALTIAYIDLDHFKRINDVHGHLAGDQVLRRFAEQAAAAIRTTDRIGRFGGEEFLLIMIGTTLAEAAQPLERLRQRVSALDWSGVRQGVRLTTTIGATQYSPGETFEDVIKRADLALYYGKETGRDRVVLDPLQTGKPDARYALSA